MLRLLEFIVLFLLAYKLINELFGGSHSRERQQAPRKKVIKDETRSGFSQTTPQQPKYDNAEFIDYEEVK